MIYDLLLSLSLSLFLSLSLSLSIMRNKGRFFIVIFIYHIYANKEIKDICECVRPYRINHNFIEQNKNPQCCDHIEKVHLTLKVQ